MQINRINYKYSTPYYRQTKVDNTRPANTGGKTQNLLPNYYYMPIFTGNYAIIKADNQEQDAQIKKNDFLRMLKDTNWYDETDEIIPAQNYSDWDNEQINLIRKQLSEYEDDGTLKTLLQTANLCTFKDYILDGENIYSLSNSITKDLFENKYQLNYERWLNPTKDCEVNLSIKDSREKLKNIANNITDDIELLRLTPAKEFIDRQLQPYIKNDEFIIPKKIFGSKPMLYSFTESIIKQLNTIWRRAKYHSGENQPEDVRKLAGEVLEIRDDLKYSLERINNVRRNGKGQNNFDIKIKMWDRNPKRDLFQGNFSTCCIGMGAVNGDVMAKYLLHTCFNMIEIIDNNTDKTIGNALCYFAEADGELAFIIDNVEINKEYLPSKEAGNDIRDGIVEYSKNLLNYIKKDNKPISIYMSYRRNDINAPKENAEEKFFEFIGELYTDIYLDLYDGSIFSSDSLSQQITACKLYDGNETC